MKLVLTEAMKATILAGGTELEIDATTNPGAGTVAVDPAKVAADAAATAAAAAADAAAKKEAPADVVAYLTGQINAKDALILEANVKISNLTAAAAESSACLPDLLKIAQASVGSMQVALGASDTAAGLSAKDTVAEHARVAPLYTAKYPGGRISGVTEDPATVAAADGKVIELGRRLAARNQ